jgi:hypothetical protein
MMSRIHGTLNNDLCYDVRIHGTSSLKQLLFYDNYSPLSNTQLYGCKQPYPVPLNLKFAKNNYFSSFEMLLFNSSLKSITVVCCIRPFGVIRVLPSYIYIYIYILHTGHSCD